MQQFVPRLYQQTILGTASLYNTLVVLPTGLGKTHIAVLLAAHRIAQYPKSKVLILAPTKPLVDQHAATFAQHVSDAASLGVTLTGRTPPEKRVEEFARATYIFSTPQTIENDLLGDRINLRDVSLLVVDEAHRAVGEYAYVYIAKQYQKQATHERILALTASPGSDKQSIQDVVDNCFIEKVEVRSQDDPDVKPYVQDMDITYREVDLPSSFIALQTTLTRIIKNRLSQVKSYGHLTDVELNKTQLLEAQRALQGEIRGGQPDPLVWRSISLLAEVMKAQHALELLETQGVGALLTYLEGLVRQAERGQSKAVKHLASDPEFTDVVVKARALRDQGVEHPKLLTLVSLVRVELAKNPAAKIIVFNQYREQAKKIAQSIPGSRLFVGQMKKGETGMSQKEQKAMLEAFRAGEFSALISTSIGEEGLDIPAVDLVVFFEPIPSAIRTIQRRGRTGRQEAGRVVVLVAKGTRDVGYRWSAHHKEARMYRNLKRIAQDIVPASPPQRVLDAFAEEQIVIVADVREKGSPVLKELQELGVKLVLKSLDVGDYLLSARCCVEFKTDKDFVDSLLDGRLLGQMRSLTQYPRPLVLVEGTRWYEQRNVHPNAVRGAFAAVSVSFGVPLLVAQNAKDAAALLLTIARREHAGTGSHEQFGVVRPATEQEEILAVVAALPGVGPVLAPKLLARFGSLRALMSASVAALTEVEGVGKKKAEALHAVFVRVYAP